MGVENNTLEFKCKYCDKSFLIKQTLDDHVYVCKSKDSVKCKELQKAYDELLQRYEDINKELVEYKSKSICKDEEILRLTKLLKEAKTNNYNTNYNTKYNIRINQAFEKLIPFTEQNIISSLKEHLTISSIKGGEETLSADINKVLEDKIIVTDMSRGKALIKSEDGNKCNTTTEKVVRDVFNYGSDEILQICNQVSKEIEESKDTSLFSKLSCTRTKYNELLKKSVTKSKNNKKTEITSKLGNKIDIIV